MLSNDFSEAMHDIQNYSYKGLYIPDYMASGLASYLLKRIPVGEFLTAVLRNDLMNAVFHADDNNVHCLPVYIAFLYNEAPSNSFGSRAIVNKWLYEDK